MLFAHLSFRLSPFSIALMNLPIDTPVEAMDFQQHYLTYKNLVDRRLSEVCTGRRPESLYEPTRYLLGGGGKRIRAVLVMLASEAVGGDGGEALDAGAAVEIMHNFTLVHDDIMDCAATRRGRPTVHTRWDEGTAILVGDVMIGMAYQLLLARAPKRGVELIDAFNRGLVDVCEGQMLDKDMETQTDATLDDYMQMIAMKTGRLVEMAAEVGGLMGDATSAQLDALRDYARNIGYAFQIQDDLLDITANEAELGKRIGGDVIEGKRTYLLVQALNRVSNGADRALLDRFIQNNGLPAEHVDEMRDLYDRHGILAAARSDIERYTELGKKSLAALPDTPARDMLVWFAQMVMERNS
jgi:geranylgeranyl diphosphate synthase type II